MYSYPWLAELIFFFSAGRALPGLAGSWGLESSLGVEIQPWGFKSSLGFLELAGASHCCSEFPRAPQMPPGLPRAVQAL